MNTHALLHEISGSRHVIVLDYRAGSNQVTLKTYRNGELSGQTRTVEAMIGVLNFLSAAAEMTGETDHQQAFDDAISPLLDVYEDIQGNIADRN